MTAPFTVELAPTPGRRQGEERFLLHREGGTREIVLHDYATVYSVPGLYEEVVQHRLVPARIHLLPYLAEVLVVVRDGVGDVHDKESARVH